MRTDAASWLCVLSGRFRAAMLSYRFDSDHEAELARIESVRRIYRARIETDAPSRYVWRSICQYRCQAHARSKLLGALANLLALPGLILVTLLLRPAPKSAVRKVKCRYLKIDFQAAYQIPEGIRADTLERPACGRRYLTPSDLLFAWKLFLGCRTLYPELLFKFLLWIASVRPHLDEVSPDCLIQYSEYSAHSSLRKLFLNAQGIRIANVTHGEEFISVRSAFASFDQYHAWKLTPPSIHKAMHIEYAERFTFDPCAGLPPAPPAPQPPVVGLLWPALDPSELERVIEQIDRLRTRCTVVVRRHPNPKYANHFEEYRGRLGTEMSDPHHENIHSFIDRCSVVVGHLSAVLLQAVCRGRRVVYLKDAHLASLQIYHDYYRGVTAVELGSLAQYLLSGRAEDVDT